MSITIFVSTLALPVSASLLKSTFVQVLERLLHLDVHVSDLLLSPVGKVFFTQMYNFLIYRQEYLLMLPHRAKEEMSHDHSYHPPISKFIPLKGSAM